MKILIRYTGSAIYEDSAKSMRETVQNAVKSGADLSGADLSGADLSGADLSDADLYRADLSGADLSDADLYRADLSGADLYRADLSGADLYRADLSDANLSDADLSDANLSGANLSGANLSGADLSGADLSGADLSVLAEIQKTDIRATICAQVCAAPEKLQMQQWHTCDTVQLYCGVDNYPSPAGKIAGKHIRNIGSRRANLARLRGRSAKFSHL